MPVRRRSRSVWEGWVFAHGLTEDRLLLRLFRLFPLARVRLAEVEFLRQRSARDLSRLAGDTLRRPARSWYWPHPLFMGREGFDHAPYVLGTRGGTRVFVRLRHGFHYRLREAIHHARRTGGPAES